MAAPSEFRGNVKLLTNERLLGFLLVHLMSTDDDQRSSWVGRVLGSDYLVWGANHQKLTLEFADGERAEAVLRAGGTLRGLGPVPKNLGPGHLPPDEP